MYATTEAYLTHQDHLHTLNERAEALIDFRVRDPKDDYFFARADNLAEALGETLADVKNGQDKNVAALLVSHDYEALGQLVEQISLTYWTRYLSALE